MDFLFAPPTSSQSTKPKKLSGSISASQGQKAHQLPAANDAYLSLILAVFARISFDVLVQQTVHSLPHFSNISRVLS